MRMSGTVRSPVDLRPGSHLCWPYEDPERLTGVALRYIADGLMAGERVLCVAQEPLRTALFSLDPPHATIVGTSGPALQVMQPGAVYGSAGDLRSPQELLDFYRAALDAAFADEFSGLRVLADVTGVVREPHGRENQLRWEHLADDAIAASSGLTALCAYDAAQVGTAVLEEAACVHPLSRTDSTPSGFRLFFEGGGLVLAGHIDRTAAGRLRRILEWSHHRPARTRLELRGVEFSDDSGLDVLAGWAHRLAARSASLLLTGADDALRRRWAGSALAAAPNVTLAA